MSPHTNDPVAMLERAVARHQLEPKKMFGCTAAFAAGRLCLLAHEGQLVLRLPEAERALATALGGEPWTARGRRMREYVTHPTGAATTQSEDLIDAAVRYALG